nr:S8 family peptidase [Bacteroidota bacterium]
GVVVVNAMGNEGSTGIPPTLTSPGDADSIISVGAVTSAGIVASFSSNGPTSDGRTKPDVSTQGVATYATVPSGAYSSNFNGTSAATPLAAGVAAMLLSARPELTPIQVRDAMRNTASMNTSPNNTIGWGIVNAYQAVLYHGMVIGTDPEITAGTAGAVNVGIYVVSKSQINTDSVTLHYSLNNGASFTAVPMTITEVIDASTNSGKYTAVIPASAAAPKFYVRAVDAENKPRTSPYTSPADLYDAKSGTLIVGPKQGIPSSFVLYPNYPNPFNPSTVISYDVPATGPVTLKVFDLLGREVRTLVQEVQTPRNYSVRFDADGLSSGVYLYRLQLGDRVLSSRMMLRK